MKKVLILAANGMAGHVICRVLKKNPHLNLLLTIRNERSLSNRQDSINLDLRDQSSVEILIKEFKPNYIINCAGILVKDSNDNPLDAIYVNSYLPNFLNMLSKNQDFKLIQISTDCVFSGIKGEYTELDTPDATNTYGRTKVLGEITNNPHLTIRTSIIGPEIKAHGTGLMHWLLNQIGTINGFTNAVWSGVTTLELANFIDKYIDQDINQKLEGSLSGVYHLTNNQNISKYELLSLIKQIFALDHININPDSHYSSNKSFKNTFPDWNAKLQYQVPSYKDMLLQLKEFMLEHKYLYKQYKLFE